MRHSEFTQEIADRICDELSDGKSLRTVCLAEDMPAKITVLKWLREREDFATQYARAKEECAELYSEEIIEISDDSAKDFTELDMGDGVKVQQFNSEHVQRSRLRVDSRKWIASKLKPKKYGDRIENRLAGPEGEALKIVVTGIRPTPDNSE